MGIWYVLDAESKGNIIMSQVYCLVLDMIVLDMIVVQWIRQYHLPFVIDEFLKDSSSFVKYLM
jgi:hypothetical protein